jgi:hypothetical protein
MEEVQALKLGHAFVGRSYDHAPPSMLAEAAAPASARGGTALLRQGIRSSRNMLLPSTLFVDTRSGRNF